MATSSITQAENTTGTGTQQAIISADSHVIEDPDLWVKRLPAVYREQAPQFPPLKEGGQFQGVSGGNDPHKRIEEMTVDGVSAEVLYSSFTMTLFGMEDARLQEACFGVFNDWLIEYCQAATDRLIGVAAISLYDTEGAVKELERCRKMGLRGAQIWLVPHAALPFTSNHYDPFWQAAQDLDMPVSLHTVTGWGATKDGVWYLPQIEQLRYAAIGTMTEGQCALFDLVMGRALDRYPRLKLVLVENEVGWLPYFLQAWDKGLLHRRRRGGADKLPLDLMPSEYFERQVFATLLKDHAGCQALSWWGQDNCMWSNDFPHNSTTWPDSRQIIDRDLGHLSPETRAKIVYGNVRRLYGLDLPEV